MPEILALPGIIPKAQPSPAAAGKLRPYQETAVVATAEELKTNRSTMIVIHCGGGKTRIATEIVKRFLNGEISF